MADDKDSTIHWIKSPQGVTDVYANMIHVTWTLDDMRIRLGQLVDSPKTPDPGDDFIGVAQERAAITLSWRVAKMLRDQMTKILEAHEKANGPIKVDVTLTKV